MSRKGYKEKHLLHYWSFKMQLQICRILQILVMFFSKTRQLSTVPLIVKNSIYFFYIFTYIVNNVGRAIYSVMGKKVKLCVWKWATRHRIKATSLHKNKPSVCAEHEWNEFGKLSPSLPDMRVKAHIQTLILPPGNVGYCVTNDKGATIMN